jgi:cysteine desulfurase
VAALYVRRGVALERLLAGGGQEGGRRAGTENVLLLAGLGRAAEIAARELQATARHMARMRDSLQQQLVEGLPPGAVRVNGPADDADRLPNTLSIGIRGVNAAALLQELSEQLAASAGAACHSGGAAISPVLAAMGVPAEHAVGTLRLSTGRHTTQQDVDRAAQLILDYARRHGKEASA